MSDLYLSRNQYTSCVVIECYAAERIDETIVKMLTQTSSVEVTGQYLVGQDTYYLDPVSGKNIAWPEPRVYMLLDLAPDIGRSATSLRWREGHVGYPEILHAGFAALTLYEQAYDRFIDVPVAPELGFHISEL